MYVCVCVCVCMSACVGETLGRICVASSALYYMNNKIEQCMRKYEFQAAHPIRVYQA